MAGWYTLWMFTSEPFSTMKASLLLLLTPLLIQPAQAQVGISLQVGQPGFYGQLNLGGYNSYPPPQLLYRQPVIVERNRRYLGQPVYMRVPPGHSKNWAKHCARYGACGRPVYFVSDEWYERTYVPRNRRIYDDRIYVNRDYDDYDDDRRSKKYKNRKYYKRY